MLHPLTRRHMLHVGPSSRDEYDERNNHEHGGNEVSEREADVLLDVDHERECNGRAKVNKQVKPTNTEVYTMSENATAEPRLINS